MKRNFGVICSFCPFLSAGNTFNGMPLPDIWLFKENGELAKLAEFGYKDFKERLGSKHTNF